MAELGVEPEETPTPVTKSESVTKDDEELSLEDFPDAEPEVALTTEEQSLPEPSDLTSDVPKDIHPINPTTEILETEITQQKTNLDVYLKMKDGTMVLFIPTGFKFETQKVDGVEYSTLVFRAPDLGNTGLQKLDVTNTVIPTQSKIIPKAKPDVYMPPAKPVIDPPELIIDPPEPENITPPNEPSIKFRDVKNMSLEELVREKSSLDHQIKTARSNKDEELVKQLRKQRRHVREQINLWGDK